MQTRALYAGANRLTANHVAVLDLPEANAMRAPGEAPGLAALEIAMDEVAEKLGLDPIEFRILNDTQVVPDSPGKPDSADAKSKKPEEKPNTQPPFSKRQLVECLRVGAKRFGWDKRKATPGQVRDGQWLIGMRRQRTRETRRRTSMTRGVSKPPISPAARHSASRKPWPPIRVFRR